ncbi:MAG: hypothetical protein Q9181_005253 [Wetmoreana brouardii]
MHGKKRFERIVWAFKNVLNIVTATVSIPGSLGLEAAPRPPAEFEDRVVEISEWLSLASLQSPRIQQDDQIDPYLCRYSKPDRDAAKAGKLVCLRWLGFIPAEWLRHMFVVLVEQCLKRSTPSARWFALSCQAFQTEIVDCRNGYTILGLSDQGSSEEKAVDTTLLAANKPDTPPSKSYILWEYAHA